MLYLCALLVLVQPHNMCGRFTGNDERDEERPVDRTSGSALTICLGVPTHVVTGQQVGRRLWVIFFVFRPERESLRPFRTNWE